MFFFYTLTRRKDFDIHNFSVAQKDGHSWKSFDIMADLLSLNQYCNEYRISESVFNGPTRNHCSEMSILSVSSASDTIQAYILFAFSQSVQ